MDHDARTRQLLRELADTYRLTGLQAVLADDQAILYQKDIFISLKNIVAAAAEPDPLAALQVAVNIYKGKIFAVKDGFLVKQAPDFAAARAGLKQFPGCFKLNPYAVVNTYLALVVAQVTGFDLTALVAKGQAHVEALIADALAKNPNWDQATLTGPKPKLIMPIGAAGCGKSTFYRELKNVVNLSCDNVRYLLFSGFGPCFSAWESTLAWWVVNALTEQYLSRGYSVFYNGVNTDMEYRSPITMENPNPLYLGIPWHTRLVYFEPPVPLTDAELAELKAINLWATPIDKVDLAGKSPNVVKIIELVRTNYQRTLERTKAISEGKAQQDPFDILYSVPAAIVKLFVEQSFARPTGKNVTLVPRKEIADAAARRKFYQDCANQALAG